MCICVLVKRCGKSCLTALHVENLPNQRGELPRQLGEKPEGQSDDASKYFNFRFDFLRSLYLSVRLMSDKIQDENNSLERNCNLDMQFAFEESINYKYLFATTLLKRTRRNIPMAHRHKHPV